MGRHSLKAGFDYRKLSHGGAGINCTTGCYTFNTNSSLANSNTGVDLADLLLGLPFDRNADTSVNLDRQDPLLRLVRAGQFPLDQQAHD